MLLTITTTHRPASDLGYLLHKHSARFQSYDLSFGRAHVFYPEVTDERCTACLLLIESEQDYGVLRSMLIALSHLHLSEVIEPALRFRDHVDPEVRHGVVAALTGHEDVRAIEALIELTRAPEAHVRDWATFALGTLIEIDRPALREALVERLADDDDGTRWEALVGLARRGDRQVLAPLQTSLSSDSVCSMEVEAAALIGDPILLKELVALREWWDDDQELLDEAIRACSTGPTSAR
jgi:HEAT repeat protein